MSVVVAVRENGTIYMGADSQTTAGKRKYNPLCQSDFKVKRLGNGILVSFCGMVAAEQAILAEDGVFTLDEKGELTKKHIVKSILPKIGDKMAEIGERKNGDVSISFLLAHKDSLYRIQNDLNVVKLNQFGRAGAGLAFVDYILTEKKHLPVKERILKALAESAKRTESVSGPYVLIDTKTQQYEIVDLGGENH